MKKFIAIAAILLCALPLFGQKLTKEEKKALEQQAHDSAVEAIQAKAFVIVPTSYQTIDGNIESLNSNEIFLSYEGDKMYSQGLIGGTAAANVGEATEYDVNIGKKGDVKINIKVLGRFWKGSYTIKMRKDSNEADIMYNRPNTPTLRLTGNIVPLAKADIFRRSNPM